MGLADPLPGVFTHSITPRNESFKTLSQKLPPGTSLVVQWVTVFP